MQVTPLTGRQLATVEQRQSPENPSTPLSGPADWLVDWATGGKTVAGARVSEQTALQLSAFYCGVRVLTDALAQTPLILYRRRPGGGKDRATDHRAFDVLHTRANPLMSAFVFRETMQGHVVVWGNAYAEIEEAGDGGVEALWPLMPDRTHAIVVDGEKFFRTVLPSGEEVVLAGERVLHIPGPGFDGITGRSLVWLARQSLGLTKATEEFGAGFFGAGSKLAGILSHPNTLTEGAKENMRRSWNEMHEGLSSAHRIAILEEGLKWTQIGVPPEDAQFLQTRKLQITEIARWLKIPPHKIMDLEKATFSNIEQQNIQFVVDSMLPWFVRWEQDLSWALLSATERQTLFVEFLVDGLLRGDTAARGDFYTKMFNLAVFSPNDILEKENQNPIEGGDQHFVPLNMVPLTQAGDVGDSNGTASARIVGEERSLASRRLKLRKQQRDIYRPLITKQAERTLNKELIKLRRALTKAFNNGGADQFSTFLEEFYKDYPATVTRDFTPVFRAFGETILGTVAAEMNMDAGLVDLDKLVSQAAESFGRKWTATSRKVLVNRVGEEQAEEALTAQLDTWLEGRAERVGTDTTVKTGEMLSRLSYLAVGVTLFRWVAVGLNCPMCDSLDGQVVGREETFVGKGDSVNTEGAGITASTKILHPPLHDGCLPGDALILTSGFVSANSERWYDGDLVVVYTAAGYKLACTPNHPILTPDGWSSAHALDVGDDVVSRPAVDRNARIIGDDQDVPTPFHEIAQAFGKRSDVVSVPVPTAAEAFHGDGRHSEVAIIRANRQLLREGRIAMLQQPSEALLQFGDADLPRLSGLGGSTKLLETVGTPSLSSVRGVGLAEALLPSHVAGPDQSSFASSPYAFSGFAESPSDYWARDSETGRKPDLAFPFTVAADQIIAIERYSFHGLVYNLETEVGWYVANGVITHNCDCIVTPG